jgi:uncharacterized protein YjfI (DUF2170 family)
MSWKDIIKGTREELNDAKDEYNTILLEYQRMGPPDNQGRPIVSANDMYKVMDLQKRLDELMEYIKKLQAELE